MSARDEEIVTFRLAPNDRAAIQRLIDEGEYRNRSDFLRLAVKNALREHVREGQKTSIAFELEGFDLPAHETTRPARASRRKGGNTQ